MNDDLVILISELKQKEAIQVTEQRLKSGQDPLNILDDGKKAMQIAGRRFLRRTALKSASTLSAKAGDTLLTAVYGLTKPGMKMSRQWSNSPDSMVCID